MEFSYRTSVLQKKRKGICIAATLEMKKGNRDEIVAAMQKIKITAARRNRGTTRVREAFSAIRFRNTLGS